MDEKLITALEAHTEALRAQTRALESFAGSVMALAIALAEGEGLEDEIPQAYLDGSPR